MEQGPHRSWPPQQGASAHGEQQGQNQQNQPQQSRQGMSFGAGTPQQHQSLPSAPSGLPAQGAPFPSFHQPAHSLASLAGISQASPRQPVPPPHRTEGQNQGQQGQGPPPPAQGFALPGLSQATGQADRDRERAREADHIHIKEEEDRRHRERMDQAPQHQSQPGPPPHIHQPVAVGPRTVHGPNGLLSNPGLGGQPQPSHLPLGAPTGPANIFAGGPVQPTQGQQMQSNLLAPYNLGTATQPAPPQQQQQQQQQQNMGSSQGQGQGPGQQPILNDALSYLDQVKVQFADHPDVYNRFLDIMKDFKSGAIDTPGVIGRVSTLFAGNPQLIQGFNTFLPPGYRIECGADDDPNAIRVTTPMGTTVQSMPQPRPLSRQDGPDSSSRPANGTFTPQPGAQSAQMMFSPTGRPMGPAAPGQPQHLSPMEQARQQQQEQQAMHQQEQRGVSSLQNAVSAAAGVPGASSPRATPMPGQTVDGMAGDAPSQPGMEKRGPVEFNHAISYVNKIKNRFSAHPDIYKQFLEILQTYQRESKPIQDVYSQVTFLFKTAPDLLEDFKQFLPESAAQAKAAERARQEAEANVMTSNIRGEGGHYGSPVASREQPAGTPGHGQRMPPVGNFAPTPASKDVKRKRPGENRAQDGSVNGAGSSKVQQFAGQPAKRQKHNQAAPKALTDQPPVSPTLIPDLPAPIQPTTTSAATSEELGFFDKAKKAIGNKNVMNEFLKLCNLFSQDLIDRTVLVHRAAAFIGGNPDLNKWFREWLGYDERDILIENKPRVPSGRIMLSNCRGLGPSYRLLPKRERQKPCSGRDELCNSVLNDEWASHPTWASEDSGFIAHRKNIHEEGLHRIEEERHDYDYNIEACSRTIQLLEPIATQLRRMDDHSQRQYTLPPGLGGQSETIYKRVIMKLYGRERGAEVIESLIARPYQVIPVLLNRLKERLESWKMAQREWEKVWREQTQKMFWKSLDHQAVTAKANDRRQFQLKTLLAEMVVKYEEMKRASNLNPAVSLEPQMEFPVDDPHVILDTTYLILSHVENALSTEQPRLFAFIRDFVPLFFGLDADDFKTQIHTRFVHSPRSNELADDDASGGEDSSSVKSRKGGAVKNSNLLRAALIGGGRGRTPRKDREDSNASGSRASSPDGPVTTAEEEPSAESAEDLESQEELAAGRWLDHPSTGNPSATKANVNPQEPHNRTMYRLWANTPIYCFLRLFVMLYERLYKLKTAETKVREAVQNAKRVKPAVELGIVDKLPADFFQDTSDTANYYSQMLQKFDDVVKGELDFAEVEDALRRFYLQSGYPLYAFEKIVNTLARDAIVVMNSDSKDKSAEILQLFKKDRVRDTTTAQQQTDYRKSVEKMVKDAELFRIDFVSSREIKDGASGQPLTAAKQDQLANKVRIYLTKKDDPIGDDGLSVLDRETRWRYYIASYTSVDNTEGIDINKVSYPFLMSNIKAYGADPRSESFPPAAAESFRSAIADKSRFLDVKNEERLALRIAVNNFKPFFQAGTWESWHSSLMDRTNGEAGIEQAEEVTEYRDDTLKSVILEKYQADKADATFAELLQGDAVAADDKMDVE